jgi:hypothetical protein
MNIHITTADVKPGDEPVQIPIKFFAGRGSPIARCATVPTSNVAMPLAQTSCNRRYSGYTVSLGEYTMIY